MLKVELHTHTADDPVDAIPYTTYELIDHAVALGYDAMAVTLHDRQLDLRAAVPYAAERGLVLIPGIERTIEGRHVLLAGDATDTLEQLRARRPDAVGPKPAVSVATIDAILAHGREHPTIFLPSHDPGSVARLAAGETL
jgi:hypothetical protein